MLPAPALLQGALLTRAVPRAARARPLRLLPAHADRCACARPGAGSRGAHRSRLRGELLERLLDDGALELLAVMAQHTTRVRRAAR